MSSRWLVRRLSVAFLVLFVALVINFFLPRLMPGTVIDFYAASAKMDPETIQALIERFGLDQPLGQQFISYVTNAFQGNFGLSYFYYPSAVTSVIMRALPWSLFLIISSMIIQVFIAYFLGAAAAWKAGGKRDTIIQAFSLAIFATPLFWMAMVALYIFGYILRWSPLGGCVSAAVDYPTWFHWLGDVLYHASLPIIVMTINQFGGYQLIMRNTMVTTLKEQYIITAEAKGLSDNKVKYKHAARNAMLPLVTSVGLRFSLAVAGSIFVETIFSYPGVGRLIFRSVSLRDYPVLQGCFFILSVSVIVINFLIDILYQRLDPRIRY